MSRSPIASAMSLMSCSVRTPPVGILRRVDDDQLGAVGDHVRQFVDVEAEVELFAQLRSAPALAPTKLIIDS